MKQKTTSYMTTSLLVHSILALQGALYNTPPTDIRCTYITTVLHTCISWTFSEIHFGDERKYEIVARGCCWESSSRLSDNSGRSSSWGGGEHYPAWRGRTPLSWRRRAPLSWRGRQLSSLLESKRWISPQAVSKMLLIIKVKASWWWCFFGWSAGEFASIHMVTSKQYVHHCYNAWLTMKFSPKVKR